MAKGLFSEDRLSGTRQAASSDDHRKPAERDYDRILFSAPVRRLADKTQVFPLEKNDSIRTRLTHSHEVSNLCRSLTTQILRADGGSTFGAASDVAPTVAATVGLAHDLGNPPFGHQGEEAIRRWFKDNGRRVWPEEFALSEAQKNDFSAWEGNAQTFRLLTRLQITNGQFGLDLTTGTLAALMKYTVASDEVKKTPHPSAKKFGFFQADKERAEMVFAGAGLAKGARHPVASIMEACDDIAYSVIDVEDAIKKRLVSINDVLVCIRSSDSKYGPLADSIEARVKELRDAGRPPHEVNDVGAQYYRTYAISLMVIEARKAFLNNKARILDGTFDKNLVAASEAGVLCGALKKFALEHAYKSPSVKEIELRGDQYIRHLLSQIWRAIDECSLGGDKFESVRAALKSKDTTPFGELVFSYVSSNYKNCFFEGLVSCEPGEVRYRQLLLLTDMVSGMTDQYAKSLSEHFERLNDGETEH